MRKYEILKVPVPTHPDLPANSKVGDKFEMNDYAKECALVEGGILKSLNEHS